MYPAMPFHHLAHKTANTGTVLIYFERTMVVLQELCLIQRSRPAEGGVGD